MGALRAAPFLYDKKGISREAQKSAKANPEFAKNIPGYLKYIPKIDLQSWE